MNTTKALEKIKGSEEISCFCITSKIFVGYGDGLICYWDLSHVKTQQTTITPLIGHTNKVNNICSTTDCNLVFSSSNDCTVRQWNAETESGYCERIFKFADPVSTSQLCLEKDLLLTGSWDKQVRALNLVTGEVEKSWVASKEAIKCMKITDKYIFVSGIEPIIRAFDMESGQVKQYQGHTSWVLCLEVYNNWLLSGSDDMTIRIWDITTCKELEVLKGHKNGVTCIAFANNELFTGSYDHQIICWDVMEIDNRIKEKQAMARADLESRKEEVRQRFIESKRGKKKKGKKGKGGAKKKKGR